MTDDVWTIAFHETFAVEFETFDSEVQITIAAYVRLLERFGPHLGRPHADTLKQSVHANMKELRFNAADGVWRIAFAFDPDRRAILLVGGDKSGGSEAKFYRRLIATADRRFNTHLAALRKRTN